MEKLMRKERGARKLQVTAVSGQAAIYFDLCADFHCLVTNVWSCIDQNMTRLVTCSTFFPAAATHCLQVSSGSPSLQLAV